MKKADIKAGGIYRKKYGLPMLLLSKDIVTRKRGSGTKYEPAPAGARVHQSPGGGWGHYLKVDHGYLFVVGPQEELEKIDAKAALASLFAGDKDPAPWSDAKGCRTEMVFSLAQILGEAEAVSEQERREREATRERDRRKTEEYNEAAAALNYYLDTKLSLRSANFTWGAHIPKIELSPEQALEIAANAQRLETEGLGRGMDSVLAAVAAQEESGELVRIPQEYDDED